MAKHIVGYADYFSETMWRSNEDGLLLVTAGRAGVPNVMTIGWCALGIMWGRPVFTVMVRPSRHTFQMLEESPEFTVNVPPLELAAAVKHCGAVSGLDHDKFRETGLLPVPSWEVKPPVILQCVVHYECRIIHRCDMSAETLAGNLRSRYYPQGDFHRYYFGDIVVSYADHDALARLAMPASGPSVD
jgi:flavin reductase (DIM6/NTAB) family NADH-FMN oxidoreductase RutF